MFHEKPGNSRKILSIAGQKKWNVYANVPFGGRTPIIEYLGRSHRILHIDNSSISFKYKDQADGNRQKIMTRPHTEFLSRLSLLPKGFAKIRHSGYLHARDKMRRIGAVCGSYECLQSCKECIHQLHYDSNKPSWFFRTHAIKPRRFFSTLFSLETLQ